MSRETLFFWKQQAHCAGQAFQGCSPHPFQEIPRSSPSCHARFFFFFLIGINDSLSKNTPCFPWAVGFYFEIAAGLIFASLHPQAHHSPLVFLLLVLAPVRRGLLGSANAVRRFILCQSQLGPWYIIPPGGEIEKLCLI